MLIDRISQKAFVLKTLIFTDETGRRYALFYLIGTIAPAFGGVLAFGLMQMQGQRGLGGWRWIIIVEGCVRFLLR